MTVVTSRGLWSTALWTIGPWACGYLVVLAACAVAALASAHGVDERLDLFLHGRYIVAARRHVITALVLAVISATGIVVLLSKRAIS
jgi:hypothetical protein